MPEALIGRILTPILAILTLAAVASMPQLQDAVYKSCGGTLTSGYGWLASPGFPGLYEDNMSCTWTIYSVLGQALLLQFDFVDLEKNFDTLKVYREPFDTRNLLVSVNAANWDVLWNGSLQVQFSTDHIVQRTGFLMQYSSVSTDCYMHLQDSGKFSSPVYPKDVYPPNVACVYNISSSSDALAIDFTSIHLEACCDKISVYKGKSASYDKLIVTFTYERSAYVFVPEKFAVVLFTSDGSEARSGFSAYFTSEALPANGSNNAVSNTQVYKSCGGTLTSGYGWLASPGFPGLYENSKSCKWTIYSVSGQELLLQFDFVDLENNFDTIKVYREPFDTRNLLVSVNAANWDVLWNGSLQVQFSTDPSVQRTGFLMQYSSVSTDCDMHLQDSGNFSSPGYRKDVYPPNVACVYNISSSSDALAIDFTTIHLEACCDKISVYKGKSASYDKLIVTFKYVRSAYVFVPEKFAVVLFTSDGSEARSGFSAYFTSEALPANGSNNAGSTAQATTSHFGPPMETTAVLSTTMPMAPTQIITSKATQTVTSNRITTVQLTTPAVRIPQSVVAKTLDRLEQENLTVQTVEKIAEQLVNVTTNAEVLSLSSAIKATNIVANISEIILNSNFTKELYPVPKLIGQIAAGLMNLNSTDLASVESQSKVSVQQSLETSLSVLALAAMQNGSTINETYLKLQDGNLAFQVVINTSISGIRISSASSLSQALLETVPYDSALISSASSSPMQLRNETLVQLSSLVAQSPKTFLVYNSAKLFQAKDGLQPDNNGRVVSAQVPGNTIKAPELIKIVFPPMLSNLERKCGYWNYSAKAWSTEGCNSVIGNDSSVTCTCEHLTNFAVLLAVNNVPPNLALDILSTIGLSLSCLSLAAVVVTCLAIKKMRRTVSQKVLFNLALSLLILDLLFLFGIDKTSSRNGCIAIAALLHYFLLTSFMWMLMESILQYLRFVKVLGTYIPRFLQKTVVPAWGVPAVIVAVVCGVDVGLYDGGEKLYCMAQKQVVYYAVLLPIGIILVINWAIFIVVLKSFCCHSRLAYQSKQSESRLAQLHAQAGVAVCTLLGLTWVFGFLTAIPDATTSVAFQWLFCICNTLQGFVIFLFHCLRENALRKELRSLCCRTGPLAATSQSEDSSSTSKTASSVVSRSQNVSMTTMSSSSLGGSGILSFHKGSYSLSDAEHRTRRNLEMS